MTNETDDFATVSQDPAAWYRQPQAILDDPQLRRAEKASLLAEWALDLGDRNTAADEGMLPDVPGLIDRDIRMQDRVAAAQAALAAMIVDDAAHDASLSFPQRLWRRTTGADQEAGLEGDAANVTE
ncbi:MAG: hypothetical protein H7268_02640 [Sandarakinorhabdus sp.]|nr:hypothetical protein [Sandarakinorhabdus sp.]